MMNATSPPSRCATIDSHSGHRCRSGVVRRFNVNQDVGNPGQFALEGRSYVPANRVGSNDRLCRIDFDV
jgi:hypothetical protein